MGKVRNRANAAIRKRYKAVSPELFKQRVFALVQRAANGAVSFDELSDLEIIAPKCHLSTEELAEFRTLINRIKSQGNVRFRNGNVRSSSSIHTVPNNIG
jgi:hypothetical protein